MSSIYSPGSPVVEPGVWILSSSIISGGMIWLIDPMAWSCGCRYGGVDGGYGGGWGTPGGIGWGWRWVHDVWGCGRVGRGYDLTQIFFWNFWELTFPGQGLNICCKFFWKFWKCIYVNFSSLFKRILMDNVMQSNVEKLLKYLLEGESSLPKGEWILLDRGDERRERLKTDLYDMIQSTYSSIGGHLKIKSIEDLDSYRYWIVTDIDDDPEADAVIMGKPVGIGIKKGLIASDGSAAGGSAVKNKSIDLLSGGRVGGLGGWWGELSGKPAYAMLSRGAPAIESESMARKLLDTDIEWHGEHPDSEAPSVFRSARGWYTRRIGDHRALKIIVGIPS